MLSPWIIKLNESDSRTHKETILKGALAFANLGDEFAIKFLNYLKLCYDPFTTFNIKVVPTTEGITDAENPYPEYEDLLKRLADRRLTGHAARDALQDMSERFDSDEWNMILAPVISRDLRVGINVKTINKICQFTPYEIDTFGCQLATTCEDRPEMSGKKFVDAKLDGTRMLLAVTETVIDDEPIIEAIAFSRNGTVLHNFGLVNDQIEDAYHDIIKALTKSSGNRFRPDMTSGLVFDGEIVSTSFQNLMKQLRREDAPDTTDCVFHIFDIIPYRDFMDGNCNTRQHTRTESLRQIKSVIDASCPNISILEPEEVDLSEMTSVELDDYISTMMTKFANQLGVPYIEGLMFKEPEAPYSCTRSTFWLKYKPTITVDLDVVGWEEGSGRNKGTLGALVCAGIDSGKEITVNVGSGFSDQLRAQIWADITQTPVTWSKKIKGTVIKRVEIPVKKCIMGETVEVLADAITQNQDGTYSLRFPRFVSFRDDK